MTHIVGAHPFGSMKILVLANEGYGEAVNEFEAFGLDLAENLTVVDTDWEVGGSNYA